MPRFTKKPVEIEAVRITEKIEIQTREGILFGYPGDWLITGIKGEKYPCSDEIFRESYTPSGPDNCSFCEKFNDIPLRCEVRSIENLVCSFEWREDIPGGQP